MKIYDTSEYVDRLFAGTFDREAFLDDAEKNGATELHVQTRFFPERAMYWTRMLRDAADRRGLSLTTLDLDSELIADERTVKAQRLNLTEWIRIAALSRIGRVRIHVDGDPTAENKAQRLAQALSPLAEQTRQYGTMLVLADGCAEFTDGQLLEAAKAVGYDVCRVAARGELAGTDALWRE